MEYLYGYVAQTNRVAEAQAVLSRGVQSFELHPEWVRMQQAINQHAVRVVSETNRVISDAMWEAARRDARRDDELQRRRINALTGQEDVLDPETGHAIKVQSGSSYYWVDRNGVWDAGSGAVVGTATSTRPDLDFRELVRLP